MQIKTTRYYLIPVRKLLLKSQRVIDTGKVARQKKTLIYCQWECKLVQPLQKAVWRFLKELKTEVPFNSAILLWGIHPKEYKSF